MISINKKNLLSITLIAFCASFFLVVFGPLGIFLGNADDLTIDLKSLVINLSIIAGSIFLVLSILMIVLPEKLSRIFVRAIVLITLGSWFFSSFLYGDYGQLDGQELSISSWSWLVIFQLIVLIAMVLFVVKVKISAVAKVIYFVFLAGLFTSAFGILNLEENTYQNDKKGFHSGMTALSPEKNVLHVVLDTLQTDLFKSVIQNDLSLKSKFEGFIFFEDTLSVYRSTEMSIPMLISGEIYRNRQPKDEFLRRIKKQKLGVKKLENIGYKLDAHGGCSLITPCTYLSPQVVDKEGIYSEILLLLDIYLFKSVPDWLKPSIYNKGDWLLLKSINANLNDYLRAQHVGLGHLLFLKFVKELEVDEDPVPRYKFFHSLVTHDPLKLDADCNIVPQDKVFGFSRVEFVTCGIRHFAKLLDKLKALGVYDNTMIILSADHGAGYRNDDFDVVAFSERGISSRILGFASATMLIKPFNRRGDMKISEAQVSLRDIPKTILAANDIAVEDDPHDAFPARDALNIAAEAEREREYLHYEWKRIYRGEPKLPPITLYAINGNIKDSLSWPYSLNVPGELGCNNQVLFNKPIPGMKVLHGFSGIESWGRWTNRHKVKIVFNLNTAECSRNILSLKLKGFVTSKNTTQHAEVLLNGTQIGEVIINLGEQNPREFEFSISPDLIKQGEVNTLEFHIKNPVSPKSLGINNVTRLLGLGFESMVFQ